jgi:hypothetical protein
VAFSRRSINVPHHLFEITPVHLFVFCFCFVCKLAMPLEVEIVWRVYSERVKRNHEQ